MAATSIPRLSALLIALLAPASGAAAQESVDVCSLLAPAEVSTLLGGSVVRPRIAPPAELADRAAVAATAPAAAGATTPGGAAGAATPAGAAQMPASPPPVPPLSGPSPQPADQAPAAAVPAPATMAACSYLTQSAANSGMPPSQVQLVVDRFQDAATADQAFEATRRTLRLRRPPAGLPDPAVETGPDGGRAYSADATALAVNGDRLVILNVIDFAVLTKGKPDLVVMERARRLAQRVAGM